MVPCFMRGVFGSNLKVQCIVIAFFFLMIQGFQETKALSTVQKLKSLIFNF